MIFKSMDADGQGLLTFDELCDGFLKMASIMRSNERAISYIRKVFAESDEDGSGTLNKDSDALCRLSRKDGVFWHFRY